MRWMVEAISRQTKPSIRAASEEVSARMSGDHRHAEGLRKDYRRLKKEGRLPSLEDAFALIREHAREETARRAKAAAQIAKEIAPIEAELLELGFDPAADMSPLLVALDQKRFDLKVIFHTFPPGPRMAAWLVSQGFDPDGAEAEARRLAEERERVRRAIDAATRLRDFRWKLAAFAPRERSPDGEQ